MPKVIDHDERRRHIVDVTWQIILEGGMETATMREIAARAGFANGALKHYFPGKDDIIRATYDSALATMTQFVLDAVGDKRGIEAIRAHCLAALPLDDFSVSAGRVQVAFWNSALGNPDLATFFSRHMQEWRESIARYLAEGRADGEIVSDLSDDEVISRIMLLNTGANVLALLAPETSTRELQIAHLEALLSDLATAPVPAV
ncbi:MAG: TetR/AcrR family transcriptional regulator [Microbacterium sp.]